MDLKQELIDALELDRKHPYARVTSAMPLAERFAKIRRNYANFQRRVDAGVDSWERGNPYDIADWVMLFTPIESAAWGDIRSFGIPLWPQLPVGKYFVDFGNPVARVALECDGAAYHNAAKDARRDSELLERGWTVYRAPGWQCVTEVTRPEGFGELPQEEQWKIDEAISTGSLRPILEALKARCWRGLV